MAPSSASCLYPSSFKTSAPMPRFSYARLLRRTEFVWVQREIAWAMGGMDGWMIAVVCEHAHSSEYERESVLPKPETTRFHNAKIDARRSRDTLGSLSPDGKFDRASRAGARDYGPPITT